MAVPLFVPAPLIRTTRPMHVDTMFRDRERASSLTSSHRSADSVGSSVASPTDIRYDAGPKYQELRTMSPTYEEDDDDDDDRSSMRSFAMSFSFRKPTWGLLKKLQRRGHSSRARTIKIQQEPALSRKSSTTGLSQLHSRQNSSMLNLSPKSASSSPLESVPELSSRRCYYSIARNCPGWVLGGSHGDSCEACLRAGFFGSP